MPYLVCEECGKYYKLQEGESPEDFLLNCDCGGRLRVVESLDEIEVNNPEELDSDGKPEASEEILNPNDSEHLSCPGDSDEVFNPEKSPKELKGPSNPKFFKISIILVIVGILIISAGILNHNGSYGVSSYNENEKYNQEQIDCFLETAFSPDAYGNSYDRVGKWDINVVRIKVLGSPTQEDINTLQKAIDDINVNAKVFRMTIDDKNQFEPDMEIYFVPHSKFAQYSVNPSEVDGFTEWLVSTSGIYGGNPAGEIFKVRVFIGTDGLSQTRRSHVIVHELGHSLGLHHNQNRNSALCHQGPDITEFTDLDKTMIRMLYREDISPYMSRNQVEIILNNSRRSFF